MVAIIHLSRGSKILVIPRIFIAQAITPEYESTRSAFDVHMADAMDSSIHVEKAPFQMSESSY